MIADVCITISVFWGASDGFFFGAVSGSEIPNGTFRSPRKLIMGRGMLFHLLYKWRIPLGSKGWGNAQEAVALYGMFMATT